MNVRQLTVFTVSMMNVNGGIISNYGKHSPIALIVFLLLQLLMRKFFVAMVV
jgi:hypothetical protein